VTYRRTTAPGDEAMINVFNSTGAQEGQCGVIFFVDNTADIIGGGENKKKANNKKTKMEEKIKKERKKITLAFIPIVWQSCWHA
jgi:hypothetical protein